MKGMYRSKPDAPGLKLLQRVAAKELTPEEAIAILKDKVENYVQTATYKKLAKLVVQVVA